MGVGTDAVNTLEALPSEGRRDCTTIHSGPPLLAFLPRFRRMFDSLSAGRIKTGSGLVFSKGVRETAEPMQEYSKSRSIMSGVRQGSHLQPPTVLAAGQGRTVSTHGGPCSPSRVGSSGPKL